MPERSFGRTVRYRRTKLGLSQAKLGDLVGRSPATIRSWESDRSTPNDPEVIATLSAILGVDERTLFGKAGVTLPVVEETSPTIEEALASLAPDREDEEEMVVLSMTSLLEESLSPEGEVSPASPGSPDHREPDKVEPSSLPTAAALRMVPLAPVAPPPPTDLGAPTTTQTVTTTQVPRPVGEASYIEDPGQKPLYRVRTLATVVALVGLVITLLWAIGQGLDALGQWWDDFFGTLRL